MTTGLLDQVSRYVGTHKGEYKQGIHWTIAFSFATVNVEDRIESGEDRVGSWDLVKRIVAVRHDDEVMLQAHKVIRGKEEFDGFDRTEKGSLVEREWTVDIDELHGEMATRLSELVSQLADSR